LYGRHSKRLRATIDGVVHEADLVNEANTSGSEAAAAAALEIAAALGLDLERGGEAVPPEVRDLLDFQGEAEE